MQQRDRSQQPTCLWLRLAVAVATLSLVACATPSPPEPSYPPEPMFSCRSGSVQLDAHFENGQLGQCVPQEGNRFELTLHPEDPPPINPSPWFAFRASGTPGDELNIEFRFAEGRARYWPKLSEDGVHWSRAPQSLVTQDAEGKANALSVELPGPWLWIAGQELLTAEWFQGWQAELEALPFTSTRLSGVSREGRPIFVTETDQRREFILLLGGQHPPEITGSLTFRPFLDVLLGDSDLARRFRERFMLVIYPILNPDGVSRGHWRHNTGGVDLNRDWGPFTQPETQLVRDRVNELVTEGRTPRLMLDFHSTWENLFYTQTADEVTNPVAFASRWMDAARPRLPSYEFRHAPSALSERPTTKNYFHARFGIPAITVETGDETDRDAIERSAPVFAEEMMRLMLQAPPP